MKKFLLGALAALGLLGLVAAASSDFALGRNMEIVLNILREINLLYVDPTDPDQLAADAAAGMTSRLDPYTQFLPEEQMADFEVATTGKYGGIGALIRPSGDYVAIAQPYQGFPADKAGLEVGDQIVRIDGKEARGMTTAEVSAALRGDPGTNIELSVKKFYTHELQTLKIRRERIVISGVSYHGFVAPGIGYIRHDDFTEDCAADLQQALRELQKDSLRGLIIDLRDNGGGILQEAVKIVSLFTPKGTEVVSMRGRVKETHATFRTEQEPIAPHLPIVILVNSGSASASEIVAGAMQDLDRAVLVGQRTFGKGLVQTTRPVGYNAYLKITTAKYYIPSGRCIQAIDYAHRREDGSVGYVPDSLQKAFTTAGGRTVYDGGGITPEIALDPQYPGRFVAEIYGRGYIEQFVDDYLLAHPTLPVPLMDFTLPPTAYDHFITFMQDKPLDYHSETLLRLKSLREAAERERYIERISTQLTQLENDLPDDREADLRLHQPDLQELITDEIIMRRHYARGVIQHSLPHDTEITRAIRVLDDPSEYSKLLSPLFEKSGTKTDARSKDRG